MNKERRTNRKAYSLKGYREVRLDRGGIGRYYKNPLTRTYQYEYALCEAISKLFASVCCRSMCIERLRLYFRELMHASAADDMTDAAPEETTRLKQENAIAEMDLLVARDVVGHITFPMMNICAAELHVIEEKDGTHTFVYTDGIYGFSVQLNMPRKGHPKGIRVRDLSPSKPDSSRIKL